MPVIDQDACIDRRGRVGIVEDLIDIAHHFFPREVREVEALALLQVVVAREDLVFRHVRDFDLLRLRRLGVHAPAEGREVGNAVIVGIADRRLRFRLVFAARSGEQDDQQYGGKQDDACRNEFGF